MGFGAPSAPQPAKFKATNIPKTAELALKYDQLGYDLSDSDFLARFPGLVALRDADISSAYDELTGPLDPTVQNQFTTSSATSALSAFGGPTGSIGEEGSAARGAIAAGIAEKTQQKQDYDRTAFQNLIQFNPQRQFGLTGDDALNIMIGNVLGQNQSKYAAYTGQISQSNAQGAATASNVQAGIGLAVSIIGIAL